MPGPADRRRALRGSTVRRSTLWSIGAMLALWLAVMAGGLLHRPLLGVVLGAAAVVVFVAGWARAKRRERRDQRRVRRS